MLKSIIFSIAIVALAGCRQAAADHAAVTMAQATKIAQQAEANFTTGNIDAVMRQYADGAVMFDAAQPRYSMDRKVQTGWAKEFVSMQPADYRVPDRQIQLVGPDAFVSSGTEMFTIASGSARPTISIRFTDVFQRQHDGSWKIVHEHLSVPPMPTGQK